MTDIETTEPTAEYNSRLVYLARCAGRLGLYIDLCQPDPALGDGAGPFALRCAETGYDAHVAGVSAKLLSEQLDQITKEDWVRCPTCESFTPRDWLEHVAADQPSQAQLGI